MKDLFLVLKSEWYDMIESGIKKEEYREIKDYWGRRLIDVLEAIDDIHEWYAMLDDLSYGGYSEEDFKHLGIKYREFDTITLQKGYSKKNRMTFKFEGITIGEPKPEWSGEMTGNHFIIKIGERLS